MSSNTNCDGDHECENHEELLLEMRIFSLLVFTLWFISAGLLYRQQRRLQAKRRMDDQFLELETDEDGEVQYLVSFFTGSNYKAPPTGKVILHLLGSLYPGKFHELCNSIDSDSEEDILGDKDNDDNKADEMPHAPHLLFPPKCREKFIITEDVCLGKIQSLVLQTEVVGENPRWECQTVIIRDLKSNEAWFFKAKCTIGFPPTVLMAATEEELTSFKLSWQRRVRREVRQGQYIYFGFWFRPQKSIYTYFQRHITAATCQIYLFSICLLFLGLVLPADLSLNDTIHDHHEGTTRLLENSSSATNTSRKLAPRRIVSSKTILNEPQANYWLAHALVIGLIASVVTSFTGYLIVTFFREKSKYETKFDEMDYVIGTALHEHDRIKERHALRDCKHYDPVLQKCDSTISTSTLTDSAESGNSVELERSTMSVFNESKYELRRLDIPMELPHIMITVPSTMSSAPVTAVVTQSDLVKQDQNFVLPIESSETSKSADVTVVESQQAAESTSEAAGRHITFQGIAKSSIWENIYKAVSRPLASIITVSKEQDKATAASRQATTSIIKPRVSIAPRPSKITPRKSKSTPPQSAPSLAWREKLSSFNPFPTSTKTTKSIVAEKRKSVGTNKSSQPGLAQRLFNTLTKTLLDITGTPNNKVVPLPISEPYTAIKVDDENIKKQSTTLAAAVGKSSSIPIPANKSDPDQEPFITADQDDEFIELLRTPKARNLKFSLTSSSSLASITPIFPAGRSMTVQRRFSTMRHVKVQHKRYLMRRKFLGKRLHQDVVRHGSAGHHVISLPLTPLTLQVLKGQGQKQSDHHHHHHHHHHSRKLGESGSSSTTEKSFVEKLVLDEPSLLRKLDRKFPRPILAWVTVLLVNGFSICSSLTTLGLIGQRIRVKGELHFHMFLTTYLTALLLGTLIIETFKMGLIGAFYAYRDKGIYKRIGKEAKLRRARIRKRSLQRLKLKHHKTHRTLNDIEI